MPGIFLLLAVVVPLVALGGTAPWGEALAASVAAVAGAVTAQWAWRRHPEAPVRVPLAWAFAIAGAVAVAQVLPMPWAPSVSQRAWTSAPFASDAWHPISLAPDASLGRAAMFFAAAIVHVAAAWWIAAGRRQRLALGALAGSVTAICALAVVERTGAPALWLGRFSQPEQALGPFPNRNDLGVLAAAAVPLAAAALVGPLARIAKKARASAEGWGGALRGGPDPAIAAAWAGSLALLAATVLVSGSHSGLFALVAGVVMFVGTRWVTPWGGSKSSAQHAPRHSGPVASALDFDPPHSDSRRSPRSGATWAALAVVAVAALATQWAGNAPGAAPIAGDLAVRRPLWTRVAAIAGEAPLTGVGAGAIDAALVLHPDPSSPGTAFRAENDLLEVAAELGLPATLALLALGFAWLARAVRASRDAGDAGLAAGASAAALAAMLVGSLGTFVVSVPALLLFAAAAAALGVPAANGIDEGRRAADPVRRKRLAFALAAGVVALPLFALRDDPAGALAAARAAERDALLSPQPWDDAPEQLAAAGRWYSRRLRSRPTDAYARLGLAALAETEARNPTLTPQQAEALRERARALSEAARDMAPGDPAVDRYRIR